MPPFLYSPTPPERPILFSGPMVRAILRGEKDQTRRVVRGVEECPHGYDGVVAATVPKEAQHVGTHCFALASGESLYLRCPYGVPGDRLWVRETWLRDRYTGGTQYRASHPSPTGPKWKPSIHMPRERCRLVLAVTRVRVERLQDISEEDSYAEGITAPTAGSYRGGYAILWNALNASRGLGWHINPWVWAVDFRVAQ